MALIRTATLNDAAAIAHVQVESWRTTYRGIVPEEYLRTLDEEVRTQRWTEGLSRDVQAIVAEIEGAVVGFISGGPFREQVEQCDAELYAIYLLQHAQRCGIGTELLRSLSRQFVAQGFRSMAVWVLDQNPSKHFYARLGAHHASWKFIEIGGSQLKEVSYVWPQIEAIISVP